jgi:hypothetical protein
MDGMRWWIKPKTISHYCPFNCLLNDYFVLYPDMMKTFMFHKYESVQLILPRNVFLVKQLSRIKTQKAISEDSELCQDSFH